MREINFHRTRLGARATQRTGIRQVFPILQTPQVRRDDRTDRAGIRRAVRVAADVAKDRADIQTRTAADAMQGVALLGVRQQFGAAIVE